MVDGKKIPPNIVLASLEVCRNLHAPDHHLEAVLHSLKTVRHLLATGGVPQKGISKANMEFVRFVHRIYIVVSLG